MIPATLETWQKELNPVTEALLLRRLDPRAVVELTAGLIEVEGHQDHPRQESAVAEYVAAYLSERLTGASCKVSLQPIGDGRSNVVASVRGSAPGPSLMFNAHLDTVPGYGMPNAYQPDIRDGRLRGRGAADMKGALAAMMVCAEIMASDDVSFAGELVLTGVAGEENGSPGMQALVQSGIKCDFAVVGEPTSLRVATAHKGAMWVEAEFHGVATHGSVPHEGINAIYHAARFVTLVERELTPAVAARTHPLLGSATVNTGVVSGGDRPPMVPARCTVQLDRRWLPGERYEDVLNEVRQVVQRLCQEDPAVKATVTEMEGTSSFVHAPLACPADTPGLQLLCDVVSERTGSPAEPVGVQFWTDGALLSAATGTPTVVCGPGDIAQAHSLDEWVALEQLEHAAGTYLLFAARYLDARLTASPASETTFPLYEATDRRTGDPR
ncbi:M20 family metallopeptidase [Terrabacter terrigena]|uniref:Probable succinyl-diaminopimelate desuccinylase n=1 Tax=Terrabacter terrigena TaxID=574718 RepID=A0ABW3N165_9MICO